MHSDSDFALWPILPYGMEDGDGDGGNTGGDSGDQNSANNQGGVDNSDASDDDGDDDDDEYEGLSAKELRRIAKDNAKKARDAEREKNTAQSALSAKEREKLDKDQLRDLEIEEGKTRETQKDATISRLAIVNAILMTPGYEWHNAEIVAAQLNSDVVKVDSDGKVEGLKAELARVAKDHDYLLKSKPKGNDSKNKGGNNSQQDKQQQQNGQATGQQPGQGGASGGGTIDPDKAELVKNMPALAGRV